MSNFSSLDKDKVITVKTNVLSIIIGLFKNKEPNILSLIICGIKDRTSLEFIEGNIYRKLIDYPKIFRFKFINKPYTTYKLIQALLLSRLLKNLVNSYRADQLTFLIFNGSISPDNILDSLKTDHRRVYIENGFFPNTLQIDPCGVNAANSLPRKADFYLNLPDYGLDDLPTEVQARKLKISYPETEQSILDRGDIEIKRNGCKVS